MFLTCPGSVECWKKWHLWDGFSDFFFQLFCGKLDDESKYRFGRRLINECCDVVISHASHILVEWRCAHGTEVTLPAVNVSVRAA